MSQDPIDEFISLPQDQQLSTLQKLAPDKQDALLAQVKQKKSASTTNTSSNGASPSPYWLDPLLDKLGTSEQKLTKIQQHQMPHSASDAYRETGRMFGNIGAGGMGVILHPINAVTSAGKLAGAAFRNMTNPYAFALDPTVQQTVQSVQENPLGTAEAAVGQAGAMPFLEAEGKAATAPLRIIPKVARAGAEILSGTGKVVPKLVEETQAENAAAQAKAAAANTALQSKRAQQLQQHFDKTQQVRAQNEAAQAAQSRKVALERGVEQLDPKFQEDLKATEKNVRAQANEKYNTVRAATEGETVPSENLGKAVMAAESKIKGSSENIKVFRDILSKSGPQGEPDVVTDPTKGVNNLGTARKGEPMYDLIKSLTEQGQGHPPLTFSDLQGYYSELGEKLSSGNLPGDVYQAMKSLQGSIADLMQGMAESKGVGAQLTDARAFYRDYINAFRDSKSPLNKAMNATERGKAIAALKTADQSGVETLARYNPELARRANNIRNYQAEAKSIPAKVPAAKPEPTLPPKPAPVLAETKKIGLKEIQGAKEDTLRSMKKTGGLAGASLHGAGVWHFVQSAVHGSPEGMLGGATLAAAPYALAKIFKSPAVMKILTQPTPADIAVIPPEIRGDLPAIVDAAQKSGIKVHPTILLMAHPNAPQQ